jgi:hypothetical protein
MKLEIEIDENYIAEMVSQKIAEQIAKRIVTEYKYENREAKIGVRDGVKEAVKQYIYSEKDSIIERVVDRASVEIVRKGLPKLLDRLGEK